MKMGQSLTQIAEEIERQVQVRKDYVAPTSLVRFEPRPGGVALHGVNGPMAVRPIAHGQIAQDLDIPKAYYDRMLREQPHLLAENVNTWLHEAGAKRLVRTLDGEVRGWLTDKYRPLDNYDLMQAALPVVRGRALRLESSALTESRLYLKIVDPSITAPAPNARQIGDLIAAGVVISNSEIGFSRLSIEALMWQLSCRNGAITGLTLKRMHVGKRQASLDDAVLEILSSEAKAADDKAFWLAFRDTLAAALDVAVFQRTVEKANAAAGRGITGSIEATVERVVESVVGVKSDAIKAGLLKALVEGGDLSQYGMQAAVTRYAQSDDLDYDAATDLERAGGKIIDLSASDWKALAA